METGCDRGPPSAWWTQVSTPTPPAPPFSHLHTSLRSRLNLLTVVELPFPQAAFWDVIIHLISCRCDEVVLGGVTAFTLGTARRLPASPQPAATASLPPLGLGLIPACSMATSVRESTLVRPQLFQATTPSGAPSRSEMPAQGSV